VRIAVLTTSFPRFVDDEASVFVARLVEGFSEIGLRGRVIVPLDRGEPESDRVSGFVLERFRYGLFRRGALAFGAGILPKLRENPLLIFQAPTLLLVLAWRAYRSREDWEVAHANWIAAGISAWLVKLVSGKPYVITLRGEDAALMSWPILRPFLVWVLRGAAFIVSVNNEFLEQAQERFGLASSCLVCIPNGVRYNVSPADVLDDFREDYQIEREGKYLLFVGRIIRLKEIEVLIRALARAELGEYKLILCGRSEENYEQELKELAQELGCEERVRFEGPVSPATVERLLSVAHYYVSASNYEGRSNAVLEALASGTPVVASRIAGHAEVIQEGENGLLFEVGDEAELAARIAELDRSPELFQRLATNGPTSVSELTWKASAEKYFQLFTRALQPQ